MKNFAAFERVRASGKYNMLESAAQRSTKLSDEDFMFVLDNYHFMRKQYLDQIQEIEKQQRKQTQLELFPELS